MRKNKVIIITLTIILFLVVTSLSIILLMPPKITNINLLDEVSINDTKTLEIKIKQANILPLKCRVNKEKWIDAKDDTCKFEVKSGVYNIEVKNIFRKISQEENIIVNGVKSISLEGEKFYLALDETIKLKTTLTKVGEADETLEWESSNPEIVSVKDGEIKGLKVGESNITVYAKNNQKYTTKIIVTDLIKPMYIDNNRQVIPCNAFTEEENKILDEILRTKIELKGEGTRAALIEAIRFLTMSFKYKIPYFFENGRLNNYGSMNHVDGEGRYYKQGLYLSDYKKDEILASFAGPSIWGCPLTNYDTSYGWGFGVKYPNGLDCSGFVTWAFINAGIDIGDIGSGVSEGVDDVSDYGEMHELTYEFANSGKFKVGDIIAIDGHTALIAGIDDEYIYIAESLLKGVVIEKFSYKDRNSKLYRLYTYINTLDDVYESDGIYDNMW